MLKRIVFSLALMIAGNTVPSVAQQEYIEKEYTGSTGWRLAWQGTFGDTTTFSLSNSQSWKKQRYAIVLPFKGKPCVESEVIAECYTMKQLEGMKTRLRDIKWATYRSNYLQDIQLYGRILQELDETEKQGNALEKFEQLLPLLTK